MNIHTYVNQLDHRKYIWDLELVLMPEFAAFLMSSRQKNGSGLLLLRFCLLEESIAQTHVKNTLPRDPNSVRPILWKIVVVYVVVFFYATLCLGRRTWRWFSSLRKLSKKAPFLLQLCHDILFEESIHTLTDSELTSVDLDAGVSKRRRL